MNTPFKILASLALVLFLQPSGACQSFGGMAVTILNGPSQAAMYGQSLSQATSGPMGPGIGLISSGFAPNNTPLLAQMLDQTISLGYSVPFWVLKDRNNLLWEIDILIAKYVGNQDWWAMQGKQRPNYQSLAQENIERLQREINELLAIQAQLEVCGWKNFGTYSTEVHAEIMYKDILSGNGLLMANNGAVELHNVPRSSLEGLVVSTKLIYRK